MKFLKIMTNDYRIKSEKKDLDELLKSYELNLKNNIKPHETTTDMISTTNYYHLIDIGGGDGCLTEELMHYFELSYQDVLIVDPIKPDNDVCKFKTITPKTFQTYIYRTNLVSCLMSIHHFNQDFHKNMIAIFKSININGYLLIKEHDVVRSNEVSFLDQVHQIYAKYKNGDLNTVLTTYYPRTILEDYICKNGFRLLKSYSRTDYNPQKKYHSLFRKVSSGNYSIKNVNFEHSNRLESLTNSQITFLSKLKSHYE